MTCKFATYSGNPKKVYKSVTFTKECSISAYEEVDDLTCDFVILGTDLHSYNYMEVDWDGHTKYYFIELRGGMQGGRTRVRARCDVLTTYKQAIYDASAIINRTSKATDEITDFMLRDNKVTTTSNTILSSERLGSVGDGVISNQEYYYVGILQSVASEEEP